MPRMRPVCRVLKCGNQPVPLADNAAAAMVEMEMRQEDVRDIVAVKAMGGQGFVEGVIAMKIIVAEEAGILLVPDTVVHQDELVALLDEQASQGPGAEVILIRRMDLAPKGLWNDAEHGAA